MHASEHAHRPPAPRRRGRIALFLAAALVAGMALAGLGIAAGSSGPFSDLFDENAVESATPIVDRAGVAREGIEGLTDTVEDLLDRRGAAVVAKDRRAFLATIDPADRALRKQQARWFDNLAQVPLDSWTYRLRSGTDAELPDAAVAQVSGGPVGTFGSRIRVGVRIAGYDNADLAHEEVFVFAPRADRWYVAGRHLAPGRGNTQLWDVGPVQALSTKRALVLGLPPTEQLRPIAAEVGRAVPRIDAVWGRQWARRVLVLVTRTEREMADLLGGKPSQYAQLAAITRGELGVGDGTAAAERVVINPRAYAELSDIGRQVIVTHEAAHVALRSVTQTWTPMWLAEGFADYIGYQDSGLSVRFIAQELVDDLRAGFRPRALPSDGAFDTTNARLPQAYELSWLACRMIAEQYSEQALLEFVRSAGDPDGGPGSVQAAFVTVLGTTEAKFTRDWRRYVADVLA